MAMIMIIGGPQIMHSMRPFISPFVYRPAESRCSQCVRVIDLGQMIESAGSKGWSSLLRILTAKDVTSASSRSDPSFGTIGFPHHLYS